MSLILPSDWAGRGLPLSKRAREMMVTDQADGALGGLTSLKLVWRPAHWGLGWEVKGGKRRHWTGEYTSPRHVVPLGRSRHAGLE